MKTGRYLALAVCMWLGLILTVAMSQGGDAAPFTCADLVGRTYRVFIPSQQFVCFEFISAGTVVQTYARGESFSVEYTIQGEKPGVCMILTQVSLEPYPSAALEARITDERVLGRAFVAIPGGLLLPVIGQRVETGTCEPGGPKPGVP